MILLQTLFAVMAIVLGITVSLYLITMLIDWFIEKMEGRKL